MDGDSGEFSDDLDAFEESIDESKQKHLRNQTTYKDKPYDEAIEISQDLSMAESFDGRDKQQTDKVKTLKNDKYDEAVDISQSFDQMAVAAAAAKSRAKNASDDKDAKSGSLMMKKGNDQSKSQSVLNNFHDEALEFSHSGSDESVDTRASQKNKKSADKLQSKSIASNIQQPTPLQTSSKSNYNAASHIQKSPQRHDENEGEESSDGGGGDNAGGGHNARGNGGGGGASNPGDEDVEESYDNLENAYNAKDYAHLNVTAEVRDLFQYIERYKPQEVELDTPLRCFIPEYIPAIGELDAFIKVPRPDGKEDGLGLRYLDEPSTTQSDPTVLELQLRAKSKKLQYGDVVVRSIEHADKNPAKIDRWIQDIAELHRSKPPPQVNYKRNMPEMDALLDAWPPEFEALLNSISLPSPDLDLSLAEYARTLCAILDIPTYDNPLESLHLLFTLFIDFRNNPHFQQRMGVGANGGMAAADDKFTARNNYGAADVMEMDQEYK